MVSFGDPSGRLDSVDEAADLDEVVVEHAVAAPGSGAVDAVDTCSVETEVAFRAADPSFASGSPADHLAERPPILDLLSGFGWFASGRQHNMANTLAAQVVLDALLAVTAIGGDRSRRCAGALLDPSDRGSELRCVGRVALLQVVIEHDAVLVVDDLRLVATSAGTTVVSARTRLVRSNFASAALVSSASLQPCTAVMPQRVVSFISVVGCGTFPSIGVRQNRRQVIESLTSLHRLS